MSEDVSERMSEDMPVRRLKDMFERYYWKIFQIECQKTCQKECEKICQRKYVRRYVRKNVESYVRKRMLRDMSKRMASQALDIPSCHIAEDTHIKQLEENKFTLTPRRIPAERRGKENKEQRGKSYMDGMDDYYMVEEML